MVYREVSLREDGSSVIKVFGLDPAISGGLRKKRPAIVICPGGGYLITAAKEQEPVAARFLGLGYQVFVLDYLTYFKSRPETWGDEPDLHGDARYPEQLRDLMRTMAYVHACAEELDIDEERVYALGFSAGAHIVGSLAERWDDPGLLDGIKPEIARPCAVLLGYPMVDADIQMGGGNAASGDCADDPYARYFKRGVFGTDEPTKQAMSQLDLTAHVRSDMPRVFMWHTFDDGVAPAEKSLALAARLMDAGVPVEYHLFQRGGHGNALADATSAAWAYEIEPREAGWVQLAASWLEMDDEQKGYSHE